MPPDLVVKKALNSRSALSSEIPIPQSVTLTRGRRGRNAEPRQPHAAACSVHQNICRLDVLMDKASLMHSAERPRKRHRDAQKLRYVQWSAKQSINRRTAGSSSTSVMRSL
jgi:hypothetical protein